MTRIVPAFMSPAAITCESRLLFRSDYGTCSHLHVPGRRGTVVADAIRLRRSCETIDDGEALVVLVMWHYDGGTAEACIARAVGRPAHDQVHATVACLQTLVAQAQRDGRYV